MCGALVGCVVLNDKLRNTWFSSPALYFACYAGSTECVGLLISNGADPNISDAFQQTPLFPACENGHSACIHAVSDMPRITQKVSYTHAFSCSKVGVTSIPVTAMGMLLCTRLR